MEKWSYAVRHDHWKSAILADSPLCWGYTDYLHVFICSYPDLKLLRLSHVCLHVNLYIFCMLSWSSAKLDPSNWVNNYRYACFAYITLWLCLISTLQSIAIYCWPLAVYLELSGPTPTCYVLNYWSTLFRLKLLVNFLSLLIARLNWLARPRSRPSGPALTP
jgi:hypothetical protein